MLDLMHAIWQWLSDNGTALGGIIAAIPIFWAIIQFIRIRRAEARRVQFTTYHDLIKQLVQPEDSDQGMKIDRQVAVIFELRRFEHYYPVTLRILQGLRADWAAFGAVGPGARLINEIDLTIADIQKKV
jgi:hypothetical protein